jgi:uncharacterized membrane protein YphA (DoxX/SURF4 family)
VAAAQKRSKQSQVWERRKSRRVACSAFIYLGAVIPADTGAATMNAIRYFPFVGRLFIGLPFVVSGLSKLATYGAMIGLIASSKRLLLAPIAYVGAIGLLEVVVHGAGAISIDN